MDSVSAAGFSNAIAGMASALQAERTQMQLGAAVLNQVLDSQQQQAQAIVRMIQQSTAAARGGVDVYA
jgi:hypothetical protein